MLQLIRLTAKRAREERLPQVAGSLTFTTMLSTVPLLAVGFALFARFALLRPIGAILQEHLLEGLLPAEIARIVLRYLRQFTANTGGLTPVGFLFLVGTALATAFTVERVLNRVWQVRKERPLLRRLGLFVVMVVVAPVLVGTSLWVTSLWQSVGLLRPLPTWAGYVLAMAPVLLAAAGFAGLFYYVPNANVRRREALVGGFLAGIAFELGKLGFAIYLQNVPTYRTVYGAFAPLLAFLLWVYFSWLVTLAAALVTANLGRAGKQPARRLARA
ncbi:YihY family inner membrane protein [Ramlibacter sp. MMS24-I3-19]|uniref:YihY family inner membrane protein n=1 Tax=Ramlibacter sp. MMS24-I3-19 TaxID=3416606 RepID=UPI003D0551BD